MPKNFKKLLVCIVATFGITAMVFSCCRKIGLCASSSQYSFSDYPLPLGDSYGFDSSYFDSNFIPALNTFLNQYGFNDMDNVDFVTMVEFSSNGGIINVWYTLSGYTVPHLVSPNSFSLNGSYYFEGLHNPIGFGKDNSGNWSFNLYPHTTGSQTIYFSTYITEVNNSYVLPLDTNITGYPMYSQSDTISNDNDVVVFSKNTIIGPIGHSKGGVLSNYIDSDDLIENSSDLPKVDTSAPSNSSSIPDWLQKILNGIGRVNQSIQGGVLTIGDYLGSLAEKIGEWFQHLEDSVGGFFDRVHDSLDDIIDTIEGLKDGSTVALAQATWEDEFDDSIFKDFVDLKGTIEDDVLTPIRNANAPSTLSFTIPLISVNVPRLINNGGSVSTATNNVYLFGQSATLDFSWYTRSISGGVFNGSSIRDYLVPIIATFLYVGMVVHLLFKIPSFLSGSSGFSNTLHSVVVSNNGSKFKKA